MRINQVADPYLRKRIVFAKDPARAKKRLAWIIFIIILLLSLLGYFSPQLLDFMAEKKPFQAQSIPSTQNNATPQPTVSHESPLPTSQPPKIQPPAAYIEPTTVQTAETLFILAQQQLAKAQLTVPEGDNAYETYQKLKPIAPQMAQTLLDAMVDWYGVQGEHYLTQGQLTRPQADNAYDIYTRIKNIAPQHPQAQVLLNQILTQLQARAQQHLADDRLIEPQADNAYATYQEIALIDAQAPQTQALRDEILSRLLTRAERQMQKHHYTTPEHDNAAETYQAILDRMPENKSAQQGLKAIAAKYHQLASRFQQRRRYNNSLKMIERGLQIVPDDAALLQLKQEISQALSKR